MPENAPANPASSPVSASEPLALCGIGCRFPGGIRDTESFWRLLTGGKSAITEVPDDRWDAEQFFHPDPDASGRMITKWGGFVDQLKEFDAAFWGISPREASRMDPQQRWLLETAWEALEDAGIPPAKMRGSNTGVFVGISSNDYGSLQLSDEPQIDLHTNSGGTMSIAANRISYQFDFKGPSIAVDTACSSALVAVSQACEAIWSGRCTAALAGGVNALITPHSSIGFSKANMLSPSGKCFAFDARADGYVRGEGAGLVFLKPLSEAIENGDRIYATIRAAVVNQDGHTSTMTVPSIGSQSRMLRLAYRQAGISPRRVAYIEAHGTGTPVGDPIEARALGEVLGEGREATSPCLIGSVKTNLGHLESASGAAGLIKAALLLEQGEIPPCLNFETPNPDIPFDELKLKVATGIQRIPSQNGFPPVASVNSFGFGGTNAHVILEGFPALQSNRKTEVSTRADRPFVLPISARDETSLCLYAKAFSERLRDDSLPLEDFCYSAGARKEHHSERLIVLGSDAGELGQRLQRWIAGESQPGVIAGSAENEATSSPVFVYTGQGPQWWGMGRTLLEREPLVRDRIDEIDALLQPHAGWSLADELTKSESESRMGRTAVAQPALFALQVALTDLWRSWGIEPGAVVGHSVGEIAAAYAAGIFSLEDAVRIVHHRSRLQETTRGCGRMLAAGISPSEARRIIADQTEEVQLAAINSPDLITLAGDATPLEELAGSLESEGRFVRWLPVDHAFHTHQMDPIRGELIASLATIRPQAGKLPFYSTVTGDIFSGEKLDAGYWWRNVRQPVLFGPAISRLSQAGESRFVEIGPHPSLQSSLAQFGSGSDGISRVFHTLRRDADDSEEILSQLAGLHLTDVPIDWAAVNRSAGNLVRLPAYPWNHQPHWLDHGEMASRLLPESHPFLGKRLSSPKPAWECEPDPRRFGYLDDHQFWNSRVFPASGYGEIGLALAAELFPGEPVVIEEIESLRALFFPENDPRSLRVTFEPEDKSFAVHSAVRGSNKWELNARGRLLHLSKESEAPDPADLDAIRSRLDGRIGHEQFYAEFHAIGYQFGPHFCLIETVWRGEGEALVEIPVPESVSESVEPYRFHPALLDACLQASRGVRAVPPGAIPGDFFFLPESIRRVRLWAGKLPSRLWAHAVERDDDSENAILTDIRIFDDRGRYVAEVLGFRATRMDRSAAGINDCLYGFRWVPGSEALDEPGAPESEDEHSTDPVTRLILADDSGNGDAVAERVEAAGGTAVIVRTGDGYREEAGNRFTVRPDSKSDLRQLLFTLAGRELSPASILHCWSLDQGETENMDSDQLWDSQTAIIRSALSLCQALEHSEWEKKAPRLHFLTRGLASAALTGFIRVANNEQFENRWTTIDLDAADVENWADDVFSEITGDREELEVAYRNGKRLVRELGRVALDDLPKRNTAIEPGNRETISYRLETSRPGVLANLSLNATRRFEPGPDEVEIRVEAGGVNFRDVMKALGMYPGDPVDLRWFGDDFSGTVLRAGSDVIEFEPGDRVAGIAPYCFRSHVIANRHLLFKLPEAMSFEQAATLPTVFLTAHYSLVHLARMQPGESILIHAGAGGVGQAAIQVAQHLGLEIFATAGSPEKRRTLQNLGIAHVMDSRSLDFADEIMEITNGEGVDAVLNSLAGPFIPKSLSVLAPFGRFLEIGKVDVYGRSKIGLDSLKDNISCHVIDLAQQLEKRPEKIAALFAELSGHLHRGDYRPLPATVFPVSEAPEAFRFMARAEHIGKVVLSFEDYGNLHLGPCTEPGRLFRPDAAYLITGGAGGFGWETAKWMADEGARNLVLMSRSGPDGQTSAEISRLADSGIRIDERRGDVTDSTAVDEIVRSLAKDLPPLKGVIHAAMVLDDAFIGEMQSEQLDCALKPKLLGAWNLHRATRDLALDHFICFSSFSAVIGGVKQANYNAGNAFLDGLVEYRRSSGLPATSVSWGAIQGAGAVHRDEKTADYLKKTGMVPIPVAETLRILRELLLRDPGTIAAGRVTWEKLARFSPLVSKSPAFASLARNAPGLSSQPVLARLSEVPPGERSALIQDFLEEKVATVLGVDPNQVDRETPITNLGLDSLMAVELVHGVEAGIGMKIPMGNLMSGPSVRELSEVILSLIESSEGDPLSNSIAGSLTGSSQRGDSDERDLAFWINELEGAPIGIRWPGGPTTGADGLEVRQFHLGDELAQQFIVCSAENGFPPESALLAAFLGLLHTFTGAPDLLVGTNQTILRSRTEGDPSFLDLLADTHATAEAAARIPLPDSPSLCKMLADPFDALGWPPHRVEFEMFPEGPELIRADLKLNATIADGTVAGCWIGDASRFDAGALERVHKLFSRTLENLVANPGLPLSQLIPLSDKERQKARPGSPERIRFQRRTATPRVDLLADACLDPAIQPGVSKGRGARPDSPSHLFLTGGTGFLGAFLLNELLSRTDAEIVCLVRAETEAEGRVRLRSNLAGYGFDPTGFDHRVKTVAGDLSQPQLGLASADFDALAAKVDGIYHNGADVNLVLPYEALRPSNVEGTREILRLACHGGRAIPTHVVSTFTVQTTAGNRGAEVSEKDLLPSCDSLLYGYSQSKWVAEKMIEEVRRRGLPVSIYRPGHITGDSGTGASNTGDLLHTLLLGCWQLGMAPLRDAEFDVTPVDYVARALVELSFREEALGGTYHLTNPRPLRTREFAEWIDQLGLGVKAVPFDQWRERLLEIATQTGSEAIGPLVEILAPRALGGDDATAVHPRFNCDRASALLAKSGITCAPADTDLFSTYLGYLRDKQAQSLPPVAEVLS